MSEQTFRHLHPGKCAGAAAKPDLFIPENAHCFFLGVARCRILARRYELLDPHSKRLELPGFGLSSSTFCKVASTTVPADNQTIYKKRRYDAAKDFTPVTLWSEQPMV